MFKAESRTTSVAASRNFTKGHQSMKKFSSSHVNSTASSNQQLIIYGRHAVLSALQNPKRKIQKLLITSENRTGIEKLAPKIPFSVIDKKEFAKLLPADAVHKGFALYCNRL